MRPFNLKYYKEGHPETEIAYMGCRTRVVANAYDPSREITGASRQPLLHVHQPAAARHSRHAATARPFSRSLDEMLDLVVGQLLERLRDPEPPSRVRNFPFLMGQGVWLDSEKLGPDDEVREVLKHGTLSIGFIGLAECLKALTGAHHGESAEAQALGLEIIGRIRDRADRESAAPRPELLLPCHPGGGPLRPLCPDGCQALRRDPRRDGPRVLHKQLPCAGVLSDLCL